MENNHPIFSELTTRQIPHEDIQVANEGTKNTLIQQIFTEWKEEAPYISSCFKNRDRMKAREPMIYQLSRFLQVLFLVNNKTLPTDLLNWKEHVKELANLPVNGIERLSFIFEQPDHYQSFIQLSEMFIDWEKKTFILQSRNT